jgi:hypothetical protein
MQLCQYKGSATVERNMDLIRELLIKVAANPQLDGSSFYTFTPADIPTFSQQELNYHVDLLFEGDYVEGNPRTEVPMISKLTWAGHEFVDNIRDPRTWNSVKERVSGLPGAAITVVAQLALAEMKKHLGLG